MAGLPALRFKVAQNRLSVMTDFILIRCVFKLNRASFLYTSFPISRDRFPLLRKGFSPPNDSFELRA